MKSNACFKQMEKKNAVREKNRVSIPVTTILAPFPSTF